MLKQQFGTTVERENNQQNKEENKEDVVGLDEEKEEDTVILVANDGTKFEISKKAAMLSNLIKQFLKLVC